MTDLVFVDTNVLVYSVRDTDEDKDRPAEIGSTISG